MIPNKGIMNAKHNFATESTILITIMTIISSWALIAAVNGVYKIVRNNAAIHV